MPSQPYEANTAEGRTPSHASGTARRAAELLRAAKESSLERVAELEALARQLAAVSPHQLRHGLAYRLWKQAMLAHIQRILEHNLLYDID